MTQNPIRCPAHNARHRQSIHQSWSFRRRQNPEFQQPVRVVKLRKPPYFNAQYRGCPTRGNRVPFCLNIGRRS